MKFHSLKMHPKVIWNRWGNKFKVASVQLVFNEKRMAMLISRKGLPFHSKTQSLLSEKGPCGKCDNSTISDRIQISNLDIFGHRDCHLQWPNLSWYFLFGTLEDHRTETIPRDPGFDFYACCLDFQCVQAIWTNNMFLMKFCNDFESASGCSWLTKTSFGVRWVATIKFPQNLELKWF